MMLPAIWVGRTSEDVCGIINALQWNNAGLHELHSGTFATWQNHRQLLTQDSNNELLEAYNGGWNKALLCKIMSLSLLADRGTLVLYVDVRQLQALVLKTRTTTPSPTNAIRGVYSKRPVPRNPNNACPQALCLVHSQVCSTYQLCQMSNMDR
jgi:hypothetical protein